jgi:hypothetical protein
MGAYLRHEFSVDQAYEDLYLTLQLDDGVIVYLDGEEVGRANLPLGEADRFDLMAVETVKDSTISLHNASATSTDLRVAGIALSGIPVGAGAE